MLIIVVAGLVVGSLLGELLGHMATGWLQDLFTRGPMIGLTSPATVDLRLVSLTFGLAFKVNLVGVCGVLIAALTLRRL